jgi:hypothetical protein
MAEKLLAEADALWGKDPAAGAAKARELLEGWRNTAPVREAEDRLKERAKAK